MRARKGWASVSYEPPPATSIRHVDSSDGEMGLLLRELGSVTAVTVLPTDHTVDELL